VHQVEFASIWCLYAALASLLILEYFRRERDQTADLATA
jgi:hypothetical protein